MGALRYLSLSDNQLSGTIPPQWATARPNGAFPFGKRLSSVYLKTGATGPQDPLGKESRRQLSSYVCLSKEISFLETMESLIEKYFHKLT